MIAAIALGTATTLVAVLAGLHPVISTLLGMMAGVAFMSTRPRRR